MQIPQIIYKQVNWLSYLSLQKFQDANFSQVDSQSIELSWNKIQYTCAQPIALVMTGLVLRNSSRFSKIFPTKRGG